MGLSAIILDETYLLNYCLLDTLPGEVACLLCSETEALFTVAVIFLD